MASPVNIGDIIAVCTVAYKVYERCKSSVTEFKELSREVGNLHIVLTAVESFWKRQHEKGNELSEANKSQLAQIIAGCRDVVTDLDRLLDKHRGLYAGKSFKERMKWAPKDIGPIRNRLVLQATLLASLNATITAELAADTQERAQAQILQAVTGIHKDEWQGTRGTSAFSQATVEDITQDDETTWNEITSDIENAKVDRQTINQNRTYIKHWIMKVILEDVGESEQYDEEKPVLTIRERELADPTHQPDDEDDDLYGPSQRIKTWISSQYESESEYESVPEQPEDDIDTPALSTSATTPAAVVLPAQIVTRTPSFGSHRSKASDWKPTNGPNPDYVEALLVRLLGSGETPKTNPEHITLVARRIFNQMDYPGFGFLSHGPVQAKCWDAIKRAGVGIEQDKLSILIRQGDKDEDDKIDCQEFVCFIKELLSEAYNVREARFRARVEADETRGHDRMRQHLTSESGVTLWNWKMNANAMWEFAIDDTIMFETKQKPLAPLDAFENMRLVANHLCTNALHKMFEGWGNYITKLPEEEFDEYKLFFKYALDVAAKFSIFGRQRAHELDEFDEIAGLVIHMLSPEDADSCPIMELRLLKDQCLTLLISLLGLIECLQTEFTVSYSYDSYNAPTLQRWRDLRIQKRSERLLEMSSIFIGAELILDRSRQWFDEHLYIKSLALRGIAFANDLYMEDIKREEAENKAASLQALRSKNDVVITIEEAGQLPKSFIGGIPEVQALLAKSGGYGVNRTLALKPLTPQWSRDFLHSNVESDSTFQIQLEIETRGRSTTRLFGRFRINEIVPDMSISKKHETSLTLYTQDGRATASWLRITIRPSRDWKPEPPREYRLHENLHDLMKKLVCNPSSPSREQKEHIDGRVYFEQKIEGPDELDELLAAACTQVVPQPLSPTSNDTNSPQPSGGRAHLFRPLSTPSRETRKTVACYVIF